MPKGPPNLAKVSEIIADCVLPKKEIVVAYVFGSVTTGRMRKDSDIDVAALLRDGIDLLGCFSTV